jgi:hypothetical protein
LRIAGWATCGIARAIRGANFAMSEERSRVTWRAIAPISTIPFFTEIPSSPATPLISTSSEGLESRMFKVAIRLCPPASSFASPGCAPSRRIASSSECAFA